MPNIRHILETRVSAAMAAAYPEAAGAPAIVQASADSRFGDYQANGAMALAKRLGQKPHDVAGRVVEQLKGDAQVSDMADVPPPVGPGFINFRLRPKWIEHRLGEINRVKPEGEGRPSGERPGDEDRLGVEPAAESETVVVDYSAPNLAKEMHVGHLRSTIIGDALVRMLDFAGHRPVKQNHVGDWGTQFGMITAYFDSETRGLDQRTDVIASWQGVHVKDFEELYRRAKRLFDENPKFAAAAREYVVRLQGGDSEIKRRWEHLKYNSLWHCNQVYKRLGVYFANEDFRGESAYNDVLPDIVKTLADKGMLTESEGAQCVFLQSEIRNPKSEMPSGKPLFANKDGDPLPLIVQKSDEGYLYSTTDLAAIAFRTGCLPEIRNPKSQIRNETSPKASRILYVVDARQALHFQMVFECAYQAGFAKRGEHDLVHVAFGTMMDENGRPFKTREGGTVKLMDLLDEAERRARDLVDQKQTDLSRRDPNGPDGQAGLSDEERRDIARKVGIGAVKYADLSQNRTSDYVFSWDKMLSLQGNTAPYMQYAYARVRSIFRKGEHDEAETRRDAAPIPVPEAAEAALGKAILQFPETLDRALADYRPNILAAYLYDLAQAFTAFYDACPVLKSDEPTRTHRLKLCDLTARVMHRGLDLLGIETAERM
ncbi:MAG: arginine--tRNA ligase [Planctomycetes bacterium]|nr:arginine--tRNA ligase [Planctomycetota bacterium]